jgi:hypothetical protein
MLPKRLRNYLWLGLILLAIFLGLVFIRNLVDFPVYYAAGQSLISGRQDLYAADFALGQVMDYRYPPFFLVALLPLWYLPYPVAAYLWYLFSIAQIFALVFVLQKYLPESPGRNKIGLLLFFSVAPYFITILHYGNAHLLSTFLLFAALYLMLQKKEQWSAILLALTITIKLTPALFLLYFAMKQKWRYLAQVGLFLLVINLLPAFYFDFGKNLELLKDWYQQVIVNQKFHELNGPINLSLKGQLTRYLSPVDYEQRVDGDTRYPQVNIAAFSEKTIRWLWLALSLIALMVTFWLLYRNDAKTVSVKEVPEKKQTIILEYGLLICLMLLIEPLTSKIYFVALLLPVLALAGVVFSKQTAMAKWSRWSLFIIAGLNSALPLIPGRWLQRWFLVLGVDFYVNLSLLVFLAFCLYQHLQPALIGAPQRSSR